jgi:hypothetical protein
VVGDEDVDDVVRSPESVHRCIGPSRFDDLEAADLLVSRGTFADWGPAGRRHSNVLVTSEAEFVLHHTAQR